MGIAGTEVAKEASSIILMDDNFASIVKAIMWGRAVNDAVKKFLQFQLTVNITAVILTFVSAVADVSKQSGVLTAVQLLWVNLIMDSLAALALATDPPTPEILERLPERRNAALITPTMWKMIGGQAIMQVVVCLFLLYLGPSVTKNVSNEELQTLVFNVFVWLQLFNEINCRRLDNHLNIFQGIHRNVYFTAIFILTAVLQVIIVQFGGAAFQTVPLNGAEWGISIAIGFLSIPFGVAIRFIPDTLFVKRPAVQHADSFSKREPAQLPHDRLQQSMQEVHSQLQVFSALRGGRIKSNYHRSLAAAAVMPSLMATMVGVGYTPTVVVPPLQEGEQDVIVEQFVAQSMERKGTIRSIA
jgi:Ca2+-transporting ATPase